VNQLVGIIFICYIIVLSCIFCSDGQTCAVINTTNVSAIASAHDDHTNDTEHCSPFCICACCGQTVTSTLNLPAVNSNLQGGISLFNVYTQNFPAEVSLSVWHPPKLG